MSKGYAIKRRLSMTERKYYLGLDCGTDSVGFAVTDTEYNLLKFNGKTIWGSHLFDNASTAEERRNNRAARRRRQRERQRIGWTQSMFSEEISKKDPLFFIRLNDSSYHIDDRDDNNKQPNSLFNDLGFTDKDFYKRYPTIYHLRHALIKGDNPEDFDPRLVYLAVAHIITHRGHFLFPGESLSAIQSIKNQLDEICLQIKDTMDIDVKFQSVDNIENALQKDRNSDKKTALQENITVSNSDGNDKTIKDCIIKLLLGNKVSPAKFFNNEEYSDLVNIEFSKRTFEESDLPLLESGLTDDEFSIILLFKAVYDWSLLNSILDGCVYLSESKVKAYEKNKYELSVLKRLLKKYADHVDYKNFFHGTDMLNNFVAYTGKDHDEKLKRKGIQKRRRRCTTEDFYKTINGILKKLPSEVQSDEDYIYVRNAIDNKTFMPLLQSYRNGVIPNQIVKIELERILDNASKHLSFINVADREGYTVKEKLLSLISFRIPYYVGPLGHNPNDRNTWAVHLQQGTVYPWKFKEMIDLEASEENFISRMTNKCVYLKDQDVIPKNSLLYSRYMVLNELNNVRVNGDLLTVAQKQKVFNELFMTQKKVSRKRFISFVTSEGWYPKNTNIEISGIDGDFKSSLSSYMDFKPYIGNDKLNVSDVDEIIRWLTIFSEGGNAIENRIRKTFSDKLNSDEIQKISRMKYSGWGRFSAKFLNGILSTDKTTGEMKTIIQMLWTTQDNLMQLLSKDYEFYDQTVDDSVIDRIRYSILDDVYVSPSVKRQIWQTLRIVDEISHVMKCKPQKVFLEVARGPEEDKKKRTVSRKNALLDAMRKGNLTPEDKEIITNLENTDESLISKRDRLYLYYSQMGKCAYSGQPINIEDLDNTNLYDIDHIYPYSKSNDDSLTNKVLVRSSLNRDKTNVYPVNDSIRNKMTPFWKELERKGLINEEKFRRLTRSTPLTDDELQGFVNRQLVETRQSTKVTAGILKRYFGEETKVVYSKAGPVAEFRKKFNFPKCRSINSLHHAKDAYLNIVVGNVLDTKYTAEFFMHKADNTDYYNLSKPFTYNVKGAWIVNEGKSLSTVNKMISKNDILLTRQPVMKNGKLFDLQLLPASGDLLPAKCSDSRLRKLLDNACSTKERQDILNTWTKKYGGYNSLTISHFAVVEYTEKKKESVYFLPVRLIDRKRMETKEDIRKYCEDDLGLKNVTVLREKVQINTVIELNGYRMCISGKSSERLLVKNFVPLVLSRDFESYVKHIEKFNERIRKDKNYELDEKYDQISRAENESLYLELAKKASSNIYLKRPSNKADVICKSFDIFKNLSTYDQVQVLTNLLLYFNGNGLCNLSLLKDKPTAGLLGASLKFSKDEKSVNIIDQSITGLFETKTKLS